ncbi:FkbM family methyltransferase [Leptolyngbya sp. FACHB-261]|uniref:FkbM family methyltransferase n=1 Tax=Leptolyngbya sp. FACHB-261 TaxID=2692806 RepID=UPI00168459F9|nr:FkbM family methyltransferase [Leptolyngbya sp. FACHB-261]MBD2099630.1 FkbM family methyltransferase [Leptolyngbya sp. FACHB-261]
MKMVPKVLIQKSLNWLGLELHRLPTEEQKRQIAEQHKQIVEQHRLTLEAEQRKLWLKSTGVKTVIDIGANIGQFAQEIHEALPEALIYSFEPLKDCYEELFAKAKGIPQFRVFNVALGDESGEIDIYSNEFSPSSSFLPMENLHKECFPYTKEVIPQKVKILRLDDIASSLDLPQPILVKIDVQGFEDRVISGGMSVINRASTLIIELSIEKLYKDQLLFDEMYRLITKLGFQYRGNYDQLQNPDDRRILQVDGIFTRSRALDY